MNPRSLSKRERKIYAKAREDALVIGLSKVKGELGVTAVEELEDYASACFARTTARIERRQRAAIAASQDPEFQALQRLFAGETVKRMGATIVAMVDSAEQGMQEGVERELAVEEDQPTLLRELFSGRRR